MTRQRVCAAVALLLLIVSCRRDGANEAVIRSASPTTTAPSSTSASPTTTASADARPAGSATPKAKVRPRIAVIVLENKEYGAVVGNERAPYFNKLADDYALSTSFYAITHPSLPNYLAMTSGKKFDIQNCTDCHFDVRNLVDQFENEHISWKAYIEGFPGKCFTGGSSGRYAKKHNPFIYYDSVASNPQRCAKIVPTTQLDADLAAKKLPRFVWITPDMCNSSHDCSFEAADRYLARVAPKIIEQLGQGGILVVTFDEGSTADGCCERAKGGHIATIVAGPGAEPGRFDRTVNLYSLLRLIEDRWDLPRLGEASCPCTPSMDGIVRR